MTNGLVSPERSALKPTPDWRVALLERFLVRGFVIYDIVPKPPTAPERQMHQPDNDHEEQTWANEEDAIRAAEYESMINSLADQYEVGIAYPTPYMLGNSADFEGQILVMIRPLN